MGFVRPRADGLRATLPRGRRTAGVSRADGRLAARHQPPRAPPDRPVDRYPGQRIADTDTRYTEKRVDVLAARARRAFGEYFPTSVARPGAREGRMYRVLRQGPLLDVFVLDMRTHRNVNSPGSGSRTAPCCTRGGWCRGGSGSERGTGGEGRNQDIRTLYPPVTARS